MCRQIERHSVRRARVQTFDEALRGPPLPVEQFRNLRDGRSRHPTRHRHGLAVFINRRQRAGQGIGEEKSLRRGQAQARHHLHRQEPRAIRLPPFRLAHARDSLRAVLRFHRHGHALGAAVVGESRLQLAAGKLPDAINHRPSLGIGDIAKHVVGPALDKNLDARAACAVLPLVILLDAMSEIELAARRIPPRDAPGGFDAVGIINRARLEGIADAGGDQFPEAAQCRRLDALRDAGAMKNIARHRPVPVRGIESSRELRHRLAGIFADRGPGDGSLQPIKLVGGFPQRGFERHRIFPAVVPEVRAGPSR